MSCSKNDPFRLDETVYIRHDGADMPAYIHGNSEDKVFIVVLHGAGSFGLAFRYGTFVSELEKRYAVVYWDQRGQGMSQGHYSQADDIIEQMAHDVSALISVLKYNYGDDIKLFLMGHSWGGLLGTTALLMPGMQSQFTGWIAVDAALDIPLAEQSRIPLMYAIADEQIGLQSGISEWKKIENELSGLDASRDEDYNDILKLAKKTMGLLVKTGVVSPLAIAEKAYPGLVENNPVTWLISNFFNKPINAAIAKDYSLTERLNEIYLPSLLIWGKYDVSVPPVIAYNAMLKLGSSNKKLVIFEKSMHHPFDTEPDHFAEEVIRFIETNR